MDSHSIILIVAIVILTGLSAFFSATETAFMSLNRVKVKNLAQMGDKKAKRVLRLSDNPDRLLSTVLIGNNIVNIASASLATILFVKFFQGNGATISTIVMTVVVLLFGEVTPKGIAKEMPEKFAMRVVGIISFLATVFTPLNFLLVKLKSAISKLFKVDADSGITEEELLTIVDEAEQEGGLDSEESELIRNAIEFTDREAKDILTPRIDLTAADVAITPDELAALFRETGFSRIPVYKETVDSIIGIVNEKQFYNALAEGDVHITDLLQPALCVPPSVKISALLKEMQSKKTHMAVVVDEFGGTEGIVTLEDIVEELVGDIWDEHDEVEDATREVAQNTFTVPASMSLSEFFEEFEVEEETDVATVNGWLLSHIGKIPEVGDSFDFEHITVTVLTTDELRADELEITIRPHEKKSEDEDD